MWMFWGKVMKMKISILIPFYGDRYCQLKRSLPFLLNQTYENYEIIFIDDGLMNETDLSPRELLDHPKVKYLQLRVGRPLPRSPNKAFRFGFHNCDGDFIITSQPELLIPYNAVETMVTQGNLERRNVATQYHLTLEQIHYLYSGDMSWENDFSEIKDLPNFMATVTPWGHMNYIRQEHRNHFSFSGSTRERFNEYLIPDTDEWMRDDAYVHEMELSRNEPSVPIEIETFHQEHERVYGTRIERSERIKKIRESNLQ